METKLYDFRSLFNNEFPVGTNKIKVNQIIIPIIQRDYAQGRKSDEVDRVRTRFLNAIHNALTNDNQMVLDFIYGNVDVDGKLVLLDGQQRLTTLFLLYWYISKKENIEQNSIEFLGRFTYEIRYSSREFCKKLVEKYSPTFKIRMSTEIIDQEWFPLEWKKDPTISSMLVMLDDIDKIFCNSSSCWEKLLSGIISFYFLPIEEAGLSDELYIRMNSRGRPLTSFEHFKAELEKTVSEVDLNLAKKVAIKVDVEWTNILWQYKDVNNIVDNEFLRYFCYVCDVICYENNGSRYNQKYDEFDLIYSNFSISNANAKANINMLIDLFDCWNNVAKSNVADLFSHVFSRGCYEFNKVMIESNINIFSDCLKNYVDLTKKERDFPFSKMLLLYSFTTYLMNKEIVDENKFIRRLRIISNLIKNSNNEMSDSELRQGGNRIPAMMRQIKNIVLNGEFLKEENISFNKFQMEEERNKIKFLIGNPEYQQELFKLEDHNVLNGQISIVGLEYPQHFNKFHELFNLNKDLVNCALITYGDYSQVDSNKWRYQFIANDYTKVNNSLENLFHHSGSNEDDFYNTKRILNAILTSDISEDNLKLTIENFMNECREKEEYPFAYYFIKYNDFRKSDFGKYFIRNKVEEPYDLLVMKTNRNISDYSYNPFLKAINIGNFVPMNIDGYLSIDNKEVRATNNSYNITDESGQTSIIEIRQNNEGIDIEDRIEKIQCLLSE